MEVLWSETTHSIGIEAIDAQHRELFAITNGLYRARGLALPRDRQQSMLNHLRRLSAYMRYHFATEEELMQVYGYPGLSMHASRHEVFRQRIKTFSEETREATEPEIDALVDFLVQWIVTHLQDEDRRYADYFEAKGIEPRLHALPGAKGGAAPGGRDVLDLWQEKHLALDIAELDAQHRELVLILQQANDLLRANVERQRAFLPRIIQKMAYYSEFHFSFEEELFARQAYPGLPGHRKMHSDFIAETQSFAKAYEIGDPALAVKIVEFLKDWTVTHILEEDRKFKAARPG